MVKCFFPSSNSLWNKIFYNPTERNIGRSELIILRFVARKEVRLSGLDGHRLGTYLGQVRNGGSASWDVDWTRKPAKCSVWAPRRAVSVSHCVVVRTGLSGAHHGHSGRQLRRIEGRIESRGKYRGGEMQTNVIKDNWLKPPWQQIWLIWLSMYTYYIQNQLWDFD